MQREEMIVATHAGLLLELPLGNAAETFDLEKVVCSSGLFMMAPNRWDSLSKTLSRPLRLSLDGDGEASSVMVHVSHPRHSDHALHLRAFGVDALFPLQEQSLRSQVKRMLRLSDEENTRVKEFHEVHEEAKHRGFGRLFRSPTLFEDMVKCILLCNCQWSRTLSMVQALCELQLELQHPLSSGSEVIPDNGTISSCQATLTEVFVPKTPVGKEPKRRSRIRKRSIKMASLCAEVSPVEETVITTKSTEMPECTHETGNLSPNLVSANVKEGSDQKFDSLPTSITDPQPLGVIGNKTELDFVSYCQPLTGTTSYAGTKIGNFPSPRELASLNQEFLARRCNLGYRAGRVINLARGVVDGRIQLREYEDSCDTQSLSDYKMMFEKLRTIDGFGPFTCANVLMCLGFYHVIPTDSETIRHLKQVHARSSTIRTIQGDLEGIYGKYAPYQFLAYWSEVWHFYEERFGNLSEMPHSDYKLITAANMKPKGMKNRRGKKIKLSLEDSCDGCTKIIET